MYLWVTCYSRTVHTNPLCRATGVLSPSIPLSPGHTPRPRRLASRAALRRATTPWRNKSSPRQQIPHQDILRKIFVRIMVDYGNTWICMESCAQNAKSLAQSGKMVIKTEPQGASRSVSGESVPRATVLWGPISPEVIRRVGAGFPTSSVLLRPELPHGVAEAATAVVPDEVLARPDDTKSTLRARLAQSSFLEDIHVLKGGCGPARVRLNTTCYPQPRRRSWSLAEKKQGFRERSTDMSDDTCVYHC